MAWLFKIVFHTISYFIIIFVAEGTEEKIFTADFFSSNAAKWERNFINNYNTNVPVNALEIGCFEGKSSLWLLENLLIHNDSRLTCIDTFKGSDEKGMTTDMKTGMYERYVNNIGSYNNKVTIEQGFSSQVLKSQKLLQQKFSFIYVDGAHLARNALEDGILAWPLLAINGVLIFDDYFWSSDINNGFDKNCPKRGIDAFLEVYHGCYRVIFTDSQIAIQKLEECGIKM